jgi:Tfp pilus assembly protein PilP
MKTAMKLTIGTLAIALMTSAAWGQNPDAIDNARSVAKSLQQKQANDSNAALNAAGVPATSKPAAGAPAAAVKPAAVPGQQTPMVTAPAKPAAAPTAKAAAPKAESASGSGNRLQKVNVVPGSEDIQIELSSSHAVTPNVSKLSSPARILVELPETAVATQQNKIPVGSGGVKGVRIGMDGKNPPTTSVVIDLEKAIAYDVAPGPAGKVTLILHTQGGAPEVAKSAPAPAAAKTAPAKATVAKTAFEPTALAPKAPETKGVTAKAAPAAKNAAPKTEAKHEAKPAAPAAAKTVTAAASAPAAVKPVEAARPKEEKHWAMNGKRDPFFSPVVQEHGSGCSTGKKCLEISNINLRGVVKSDNGFIAVVTNNIGKAYFLRENDPVFNGYVVRITGDSVVFEETIQDKLGKTSTHEVVKKIFTPAV